MIIKKGDNAVTLGEFHQLVSDSLRRGSAQDAIIPGYTKLAVLFLERNYTFTYMEQFRLLQVVNGDRTITLPTNKVVKAVKFIRLVGDDSRYTPLRKVDPRDIGGLDSGAPTAFWQVGSRTLVLDVLPTSAMQGEAVLYEYTDWPSAPDSQHDLIDVAADVLMYQTLLSLAGFLRDSAMIAAYKTLRDESLNTLTRAEDEGVYGGESPSMSFVPIPP